jgi:hypothetical protein
MGAGYAPVRGCCSGDAMKRGYAIHPLARQFPPMSDEEFAALKADIRQNDLREPITLFRGKILDGQHRYRACKELGITPKFSDVSDLTEEEAKAVSVSRNLQRRHLSTSQQAMFLVMGNLLTSSSSSSSGDKRTYRQGPAAVRRVGERYGISHVSIYKAMFVHKRNPRLARDVLDGKLSVARAEKQIREEADRTSRAVKSKGPNEQLKQLRADIDRIYQQIATLLPKESRAQVLSQLMSVREHVSALCHMGSPPKQKLTKSKPIGRFALPR